MFCINEQLNILIALLCFFFASNINGETLLGLPLTCFFLHSEKEKRETINQYDLNILKLCETISDQEHTNTKVTACVGCITFSPGVL